jgi:hypothetical protein
MKDLGVGERLLKMDLKETECYNMDWTHLAQIGAHWWALGKMEINILRR